MYVVVIDRSVDHNDNSIHGPFASEQAGLDWLNAMDDDLFEDAASAYIAPLNIAEPVSENDTKTAAVVFIEGDKEIVADALISLESLRQDWAFYLDDWWFNSA